MARTVQSKGATGTTQASVTFTADSGGRWEVGWVRFLTDVATGVVKFIQGTAGQTVVSTLIVGTAAEGSNVYVGGSSPVFVGLDEGAVSITVLGGSACEVAATASLEEEGTA